MTLRISAVERTLCTAAAFCLVIVAVRNLGFVSPILPHVVEKAYNAVEFLAIGVCALRARRSAGSERMAWAMFALGLLLFASGDIYYTVALMGDQLRTAV